ncbi:unnamed protein product, partial [marine sediment metagenome]
PYSFTDDGTYSAEDWVFDQEGGSVIVNTLILEHGKVLDLTDINNDDVSARTSFDSQAGMPMIEFWMMTNDTSKYSWIAIRENGINAYLFAFIDSCIKYNDGSWQTIFSNAENNYWYHLSIIFDLSNTEFDLWIDGVKRVDDGGGVLLRIDGIDEIYISTDTT